MADIESKAAQAITSKMEAVEPGTPRYEVLECARRFKTSWVDLGGNLYNVRRKKWYEKWGYPSFEAYCQQEIRIKPRTAAKLTASYSFLKEEEPAILKRDGLQRAIPDMAAVELLRKVHEKEEVAEDDYRRIKEMALDEQPVSVLRKELKQALPPPDPKPAKHVMKQLLAQADRLADNLAAVQGIPRVIIDRALALVDDIRALLEH
ncbi:MAG: hypothetical protein JXR96_07865 [Deltaproteobacteria bacterium]|nr:hypothetical protein [Deltaproteobacteria bacterium]